MIIEKLTIYGYGHLKNRTIQLDTGFHVFYGRNEAGKTTILSFIETMLFGFPKRQQNELRYEPKSGGVHGGKIDIQLESGKLSIERIKGREPKESIIIFNDKVIDEDELHRLLQGIDRTLFRDIFSARLEHLREMEKLNEEDLNRFLLGTGISGNFSLFQLESRLETKQGELFKPQGRKPIMNEALAELKKADEAVSKSNGIKAQYAQKQAEKTEIQTKIETIQKEKEEIKKKLTLFEKVKATEPFYSEKKLLQLQLNDFHDLNDFPEDGLNRYERLKIRLLDFEGEAKNSAYKIEQLKRDLPKVNHEWLEQAFAVQQLKENAETYRMKQERLLLLTEQIKHEEAAVASLIEHLGPKWSHEKILSANVSYSEQENLEHMANEVNQLSEQHTFLEKDLAATRSRFKAAEVKEKEIQRTLLDDEEREDLETFISKNENRNNEQEKLFLQKMIGQLDSQMAREGKPLSNSIFYMMLSLAFFSSALLFYIGQELVSGVVAIIWIVALSFIYIKRKQKIKVLNELNILKSREIERLHQLEASKAAYDPASIMEAKKKIEQDNGQRQEWHYHKLEKERAKREYENLSKRYEMIEKTLSKKQDELLRWMEERNFPLSMPIPELLRTLDNIRSAKKNLHTVQTAKEERITLQNWISQFEQEIYGLAAVFQIEQIGSPTSLLMKLEMKIEEEKTTKEKKERIQEQRLEEMKQYEKIKAKMEQYEKAMVELFQQAGCETEEEYFSKGNKWAEKEKLIEKMNLLNQQIHMHIPNEEEKRQVEKELEANQDEFEPRMIQLSNRLTEIEQLETDLFKRLAEIRVELSILEEGGDYDSNVQKLEMKKSAFREYAEEWAVYALALDILRKTKERYRKERLPKVVEIATNYFSIMTNGAYHSIRVPVEGEEFTVESALGIRYSPKELSRGTQEQLYLSLRLALTLVYPAAIRFPILLDDLLVHFDHDRMEAAINVLKEHSKAHQILFFTCHEHIAAEFGEKEAAYVTM
ncbi:hypothetical protein DCC39_14620 [Pueribacillus theae]|uniref:YhaN AAA domain-containing protein n=1 Tax=Pueribacillus theae TaxID=2171751 RepID=A0A2U1JU83_9BACI|nr:AAA family ATPase [Pueribacillus theae]PWA08509.1 hypothetical protein DCC39_14620 [Pueribacillus theae]